MIDCVKVQPHLLFIIRLNRGLFWNFFETSVLFLGLELTYVENQLWFRKYIPIFLFLIRPNFGTSCTFWALRGVFLGLGSGSKTFLGPAYID